MKLLSVRKLFSYYSSIVLVLSTLPFLGGCFWNSVISSDSASSAIIIPVAENFSAPSFAMNSDSVITLDYEIALDNADVSCSVTNLVNIALSQECSCDSGVCSVEISGDTNYFGAASFDFSIAYGEEISETATATLLIDDIPATTTDIAPTGVFYETESIVTLDYSDVLNRDATSCEITSTNNLQETQACLCSSGVCTVGITGADDFFGAASFEYIVNVGDTPSSTSLAAVNVKRAFRGTWTTTSPNENVILPFVTGYSYDLVVNWGDGSTSEVTSFDDSDGTHNYVTPGSYDIKITGIAEAWSYLNKGSANPSQLNIVADLGDLGWKNLEGSFTDCDNLTEFSGGITDQVTSMEYMFYQAFNLSVVDLTSFDVSNVTSFSSMFVSTGVDVLDLSSFVTSSATTMYGMFAVNTNLYSLDISNFDTSNVVDLSYMFYGDDSLSSLDLSHFSTSNVTNLDSMFEGTSSLFSLDTTGWDIDPLPTSSGIFTNTGAGLSVTCDTGTFFGYTCN